MDEDLESSAPGEDPGAPIPGPLAEDRGSPSPGLEPQECGIPGLHRGADTLTWFPHGTR